MSNEVATPSEDLLERARAAGWPDELTERIAALRIGSDAIDEWLDTGFPPAEGLAVFITDLERVFDGSLRLREATWADGELVADLYANSPEVVGDWEVTTERSPFPYAQLRLQENASIQILEERRVGLGAAARSTRNAFIAGVEVTVGHLSGWRVRTGQRGKGYARLLQSAAGPGTSWFGLVTYWYVRSGNMARSWIDKVIDDMEDRPSGTKSETQGLTATVTHLRASGRPIDSRIRNGTVADLDRCVGLINRITAGLDLVRPVTTERLRVRLDDPAWGPKPPFWAEVYRWPDFWVLENNGEITACAGLWDRGRHMRDRWEHKETGQSMTVDNTAVLDFGYAAGEHEDAAALLASLASMSDDLGRTTMMAALEHDQEVLELLADLDPQSEVRELHVMPMSMPGLDFNAPTVTKPHTDLAYW